jgi:hypothetical protein
MTAGRPNYQPMLVNLQFEGKFRQLNTVFLDLQPNPTQLYIIEDVLS